MTRVAIVQHAPREILGTLHPILKNAGYRLRYVNHGRESPAEIDVKKYDALVILGGPMSVYEADTYAHLKQEIEWIQTAIALDKPVLGICLGAQLIAAALGATVRPMGHKEIGWFDVHLTPEGRADPILGCFEEREKIFQWHGDTFDLPKGAIHLARSELCEQQAFRYGQKVYGLQFHLEADQSQIDGWIHLPENHEEIERLGGAAWVAGIREENIVCLPRLEKATRRVFIGFLKLFSAPRLRKRGRSLF